MINTTTIAHRTTDDKIVLFNDDGDKISTFETETHFYIVTGFKTVAEYNRCQLPSCGLNVEAQAQVETLTETFKIPATRKELKEKMQATIVLIANKAAVNDLFEIDENEKGECVITLKVVKP